MITGLWTQCIPRGTQTQDHDLGSRPVSNLAASGITAPPERCGHSATFPGPSPPPQDTCAGHSQKEICVPSTLGACTTGFCSQPLSLGTPRLWETPLPRTPSSITATHSLAACQSRPWGGGLHQLKFTVLRFFLLLRVEGQLSSPGAPPAFPPSSAL